VSVPETLWIAPGLQGATDQTRDGREERLRQAISGLAVSAGVAVHTFCHAPSVGGQNSTAGIGRDVIHRYVVAHSIRDLGRYILSESERRRTAGGESH